jgi:DNA-binding beta-propeller fold protein YncE
VKLFYTRASGFVIGLALACLSSSPVWALDAPPIFVLNSRDANVSMLDPVKRQLIKKIPVGKEPHHLYATPNDEFILVANALSNSLSVINPKNGELVRVIEDIVDPYQLAFSPDMKWFVTAANRLDHVDIYRYHPGPNGGTFELAKRLPAPKVPSHVVIDSKSAHAYVTLQDSDELIGIDLATQTQLWKIKTGKVPAGLYLTSDDQSLWVGITGEDYAQVFDVSDPSKGPKEVARVKTGKGAHNFRAMGDKRHVFITNREAKSISLIDTQERRVVQNYAVAAGPDCMELSADGKTLWVTARWSRLLQSIDLQTKEVKSIPVGASPHGVYFLNHAPLQ